ncbi:MAG: hypothetical protein GW938_07505 [Leptospira sp.]|nr:hypothetical protein [Leptospira sp.]
MNKTFDFLLSGINSLVKLGKGGNSLKSEKDSHIEFLSSALELLPVRTKNPVDPKDSVNLEFLRENVLLNFGLPVQNLSELTSIPITERRDKQIRYVEDIEAFYQFDEQSVASVPNPEIPDLVILPNDIVASSPGRWIKTKARIQFHSELIGNDSGDDHPQYQLRSERNQPTGYQGLDSSGNIESNTNKLAEGSTNLYFTDERAKSAAVDNDINELEELKAPSQKAVFLALAGKEPNISPSDVDKFFNGLKEFVSITIGNVEGLATELSNIINDINSISTYLGNIITLPSLTNPNEFLDGSNSFRLIQQSDVSDLENGLNAITNSINDLENNKEDNLPSGSIGEYLHSDKTFKQIDYSEITGTPPENSPVTVTNINTTLTPGVYSVTLTTISAGRPVFFLPISLGNIECILVVTKGVGNSIVQHLFPVKGDSLLTRDKVFMRKYMFDIGGGEFTWFDWVDILNLSPSLQFDIKSHARINVDSVPSIPSGNITLNCSEFSYYSKAGGNATITLSNMSILQTVVLEVASTGSAYSLTFSAPLPIRWENQTQPTPTVTANRFDIYTFINFGTRIHALVALNQG